MMKPNRSRVPARLALGLATAISTLLAAGLAAEDPGATPAPSQSILPLEQVQAGQRGYGLSVFSGRQTERFDVEVVGVMRNVSPELSYILARLTGKGLEKSGVIGGMSGSPVFIDGRLAGAVAFSWPFSHEAIAGIMPIESMRRLSGLPGAEPVTPPPPIELAALAAGKLPGGLEELAGRFSLAPKLFEGAISGVQWSASGFGDRSMGLLRQALGSVTPAGRASGGSAAELTPGASVAALLVDGDLKMAATGTVTDRVGDEVFAFGHPFLSLGPTRVPMATAEIVTVLSSQYSSFKIANVGEVVGAFEQDRQAGIAGRIGLEAPMFPMTVRVAGPRPKEFRVRVAEVPQILPLLVGSTVLGSLESASYSSGPQGLDVVARFRLAGHGDLTMRQSFDGDNAGPESAAYVLSIASYLAQNPLERVAIEDIEVDLAQSPRPRSATLVGAHADRTLVRPGERVRLNLDLVPYRGERFRHAVGVDLPEDLPDGRYSLLVGDGASADAARLAVEPAEPVTFGQAMELLRSLHSRRDLVVLGVFSGPGLAVSGEVMPRLPGSVRSLWGAAASGSATPLRLAVAQELHESVDLPIDGLVRVDLEVRRRDPVAAEATEGEAPAVPPAPPAPATETVKGGQATGKRGSR